MMEKQKALFYCRVNQSLSANAGVVQKCAAQIKALRNIGWTVDYFWLDDHGVYINEKQIYTFRFRKFKMLKFIYFFWGLQSLFRKLIKIENYDLFYFRYELSHPDLIYTFKKIKNNNPLSFIVLEVPTFPYHLEKKGILRKIQYYIDAHFQLELKKYIDYIVHVGIQKKIFDIPTIRITNGLLNNPLEYSIQKSENGDFIQLVAIGTWAYWHGLDRLLLGFSEFKKQKGERQNIKLKIIGDGNIVLYKQTITNLGLANNVEILPSLPYKDMKEHLIQADIGIGTLAIFRKGVQIDSSLKHRSYCASGLPFILSTQDLDFPGDLGWVKYFPENNSPIDFNDIVKFYQDIIKDNKTRERIIHYAKKELTWEKRWYHILSESGIIASTRLA